MLMRSKRKLMVLAIIFTMLATTMTMVPTLPVVALGPTVPGPNFDNVYFKTPLDGPWGLDALIAGEVHEAALWATETVQAAIDAGFKKVQSPIFMLEGVYCNLRRGPTQDVNFRRAMSALYDKISLHSEWASHYDYPVQHSVLDRYVGELWGGNAYNPVPPTQYPWHAYDPDLAIALLLQGGYKPKDSGDVLITPPITDPGIIDHWEYSNGTDLPTLYAYGPNFFINCMDWLDTWCTEMRNIGLDVVFTGEDYYTYVTRVTSPPFDLDFGWGYTYWSPPLYNWFYMAFHSDMANVAGTMNFWGVANATVDALIDVIMSSLDINEVRQACYDLQAVIAEICPIMVQAATEAAWAVHPDLKTYRPAVSVAETRFNKVMPRWKTGWHGDFYGSLGLTPNNLNPLNTITMDYGLYVIINILGRLAEINPVTGEMIPWIATAWNDVQTWDGPWGPGQKITIWLRDDVTWHTGVPVTASDIDFNINYLKDNAIYDAYSIWWDLNHTNVVSPTQIELYFNGASLSRMRELNWFALALYPPIWSTVTTPSAWTEWNDFYMEVDNGPLGTVRLSKLVGAGPYMFPEGGWDAEDTFHLVANRNWFKTLVYSDINFDSFVNIFDVATCAAAFGSYPGHSRYNEFADLVATWDIVNIFDVAACAADFGTIW